MQIVRPRRPRGGGARQYIENMGLKGGDAVLHGMPRPLSPHGDCGFDILDMASVRVVPDQSIALGQVQAAPVALEDRQRLRKRFGRVVRIERGVDDRNAPLLVP